MRETKDKLNKQKIIAWVRMFTQYPTQIMISNYSYNCFFSGRPKAKTLIVIPEELETRGVIAIDKPMDKVELYDVLDVITK